VAGEKKEGNGVRHRGRKGRHKPSFLTGRGGGHGSAGDSARGKRGLAGARNKANRHEAAKKLKKKKTFATKETRVVEVTDDTYGVEKIGGPSAGNCKGVGGGLQKIKPFSGKKGELRFGLKDVIERGKHKRCSKTLQGKGHSSQSREGEKETHNGGRGRKTDFGERERVDLKGGWETGSFAPVYSDGNVKAEHYS